MFYLAFILAYFTEVAGLELILLGLWYQVAIILWDLKDRKQAQIFYFKYFLFLVPFFLLIGALSSYGQVMFQIANPPFMIALGTVKIVSSYLITCICVVSFVVFEPRQSMMVHFKNQILKIPKIGWKLFLSYLIILAGELTSLFFETNYLLIFTISLSHLFFLHLSKKPVVAD